jgi:hypothetical protein
MKRFLVVLVFLVGCSQGGWPQSERDAFIENCERTSGGQVAVCACLLPKVEEAYPNVDDATDITIGEVQQFTQECQS